jgi:hypothetical protein
MVSKGGRGVVVGMFLVIYSRLRLKKLSSNTPARTTAGKLLFFADFLIGTTLMILLLLVRGAPSNAPRDEALFTRTPSERLEKEPTVALDTAKLILDAAITTGREKKHARTTTSLLSQKPLASQLLLDYETRARSLWSEKELRLGFGYAGFEPSDVTGERLLLH